MSQGIGQYCRQYRKKCNKRLQDIDSNVKTLSAFESGRSSNINLLAGYVKLSLERDELDQFMIGLSIYLINTGD